MSWRRDGCLVATTNPMLSISTSSSRGEASLSFESAARRTDSPAVRRRASRAVSSPGRVSTAAPPAISIPTAIWVAASPWAAGGPHRPHLTRQQLDGGHDVGEERRSWRSLPETDKECQ